MDQRPCYNALVNEIQRPRTLRPAPEVRLLNTSQTSHSVQERVRQSPPAAAPLLTALLAAQQRHALFPLSQAAGSSIPVIVGVSGGADSVALLHALHQFTPHWGLALHVAHLDHSLRKESAADAEFVARLAAGLHLPLHHQQLAPGQLEQHPAGLEAAARQARYHFLAQVATSLDSPDNVRVAVGHHQDDQAETLLMHLLTGSGWEGLAGMAWSGPLPTLASHALLVRPLLSVRRAEIHAYLRAYDLTWREDASNADQSRLRNQIRHQVMPLLGEINPNVTATLARTAEIVAGDAARLATLDAAAYQAALIEAARDGVRVRLDWATLASYDLATRRGVLRRALAALGVDLREAGWQQIETLARQVDSLHAASGPHPLVHGWAWSFLPARAATVASLSLHQQTALPIAPTTPFVRAGCFVELPMSGVVVAEATWRLRVTAQPMTTLPSDWRTSNPWHAYVDATTVERLALTTPEPGMVIAPLGMAGHHRSVGDLLTDHKIPVALRASWPLVVDIDSRQVVWVCGLALSDHVRIRPTTQAVRVLAWEQAG